jgi:hypothetical protein
MVAAAALLAGCAAGQSSAPPASGGPSAVAPTSKRTQSFETRLRLQDQTLHAVGRDGDKSYGMSEYAGDASFLGEDFEAELIAASDYTRGDGTIEGFVTLQSPSGDIGLRVTGTTRSHADGPGASFSGETEVIGGTQEYATLAGRGRFSGERDGPLGSPVAVEVSLELIQVR